MKIRTDFCNLQNIQSKAPLGQKQEKLNFLRKCKEKSETARVKYLTFDLKIKPHVLKLFKRTKCKLRPTLKCHKLLKYIL